MFVLRESTEIAAPLERVFLLSTSLAIVERELGMHRVPAEYLDDEIRFSLPLGVFGWLAGRLILAPHIRRLMRRRFRLLKCVAESEAWREYLPPAECPAAGRSEN